MRLEDVAARVRGHATRQPGKPRTVGGLVGRYSTRRDDRKRITRSSLRRCFYICKFKQNLPLLHYWWLHLCAVVTNPWIRSAGRVLQVTSLKRLRNASSVMLHKVAAVCLVNPQGLRKATKRNHNTRNIISQQQVASCQVSETREMNVTAICEVACWRLFLPVYTGFLCFPVGVSTAWELNWFEPLLSLHPKAVINNKICFF